MSSIIEKIKGLFSVDVIAEERDEKAAEIDLAKRKIEAEIEKIKAETELLKTQNKIKEIELGVRRKQIEDLK